MEISEKTMNNIQILWDYMRLNEPLEKADCILVLGCSDLSIVDVAIDIYKKCYADKIIFTGGFGKITKNIWKVPEANKFAEVAIEKGVPRENIYIENESTNTTENYLYAKRLIEKEKLNIKSVIVVCKPYVERRVWAGLEKHMTEYKCIIQSEKISCKKYMEDYDIECVSKYEWINILVGDIQRFKIYGDLGIQERVEVPEYVMKAYEELVDNGFNTHLLKNFKGR